MRLLFLLPSILALVFSLDFLFISGFSLEYAVSHGTYKSGSISSTAMRSSASISSAENDPVGGTSSEGSKPSKIEYLYRSARSTDVSAIARLLNSVFEDDERIEEEAISVEVTTNSDDSKNDGKNTFMWDSLTEESKEPEISPEQQLERIQRQLSKRMIDAKRKDSLPHLFLVATIPSSIATGSTSPQNEDMIVGYLEMGTLPPPIAKSPIGNAELPYIANVAVDKKMRRRKIASTLVKLARKIARKWCAASIATSSFPLFLFLSVERENRSALKFYEQLGFDELKVAKKSSEKIYLAQGLD